MKPPVLRSFGHAFAAAFLILILILSEADVRAQPGGVPIWTNIHPNTYLRSLAVDSGGNVFLTGLVTGESNALAITVKYSATGIPLWTNLFDVIRGNTDIALDSNGNVFVLGLSTNQLATIKYSGAGVPLWTNYLDARAVERIAVDKISGKVFVTGSTDWYREGDFITVAYSNAGIPLWTNYYGIPGWADYAQLIDVDASGNVVVTGRSGPTGGAVTIKYSGDGVPLWTNTYHNAARAMVVDASGDVFLATTYYNLIKYSSSGIELWRKYFPQVPENQPTVLTDSIAVDSSGNLVVAATTYHNITGDNDILTMKYSGDGVPLWTNRYSSPENLYDSPRAVAIDGSGNVFVQGGSYHVYDNDSFSTNFTTLAYSNEGVPLWTNRYASTLPQPVTDPMDLVASGGGDVFALGLTGTLLGNASVIIKYSSVLPSLAIARANNGAVVLSWPSAAGGFTLQENTHAHRPLTWTDVSAAVQDNGLRKTVILNSPAGTRFYRLRATESQ